MSLKVLLLVSQNHKANGPTELNVARNDLVHLMWQDEVDGDWLWVNQIDGDRRTGRVPKSKLQLVHDKDEIGHSLGNLLALSNELPKKILELIKATTAATNTGNEESMLKRLQESEHAMAALTQSYKRILDHFTEFLTEPQTVTEQVNNQKPPTGLEKIKHQTPEDKEAEFDVWLEEPVSPLPANTTELLGLEPNTDDSNDDKHAQAAIAARDVGRQGAAEGDDAVDDSGFWDQLTADTQVLAETLMTPQKIPLPGTFRRFFEAGMNPMLDTDAWFGVLPLSAASMPYHTSRKRNHDGEGTAVIETIDMNSGYDSGSSSSGLSPLTQNITRLAPPRKRTRYEAGTDDVESQELLVRCFPHPLKFV
jgi:hypothetical protein